MESGSLADTRFIEYKAPADKIREVQERWITETFHAGYPPDQLAIALWPKGQSDSRHEV
jgi:hypothetical protein